MKTETTNHYTVRQVAQFSGVSIRTLHHYDKINLLKPSIRTEKNYRLYTETELLKLQQILFYKELGFSLREITALLYDPNFDTIQSLENQREILLQEQTRTKTLIKTINRTLHHLKTAKMLKAEELYEGFSKGREYRKEAIKEWGEQVEEAELELRKKGKVAFEQLKKDFDRCWRKLASMRFEKPQSEVVQTEIAKHYGYIREFWGTTHKEDKQLEAYACLGELYVSDERYAKVDGKPSSEFAIFMRDAMKFFAENQ
ncbi:MAG: MerR family transcriptional regulator [Bacteroidota bacterium]